jgi:hypothetical protein
MPKDLVSDGYGYGNGYGDGYGNGSPQFARDD